jgi:segregation and condensation protein A
MLLPRPPGAGDLGEEDPRAELVRRLQEYERFKRAAADIDLIPRLERDVWQASAELRDRPAVRAVPQVTLQEMLAAFNEVAQRAEMFAHHHVQREPLSVRERMSNILAALEEGSFIEFSRLFTADEGRAGVTVAFIAVLELVREGLIEFTQTEPYAPLHVRSASPHRTLHLVADNDPVDEELPS